MSSHTYTISGVKVEFPVKAYGSQIAMMSNIIRSVQRGQNALLESPTGSGKSLALLCAALAWQRKEQEKANEYNKAVEEGLIQPEYEEAEEQQMEDMRPTEGGFFVPFQNDDKQDFVDLTSSPPNKKSKVEAEIDNLPKEQEQPNQMRKVKKKVVPKIYFGTRTHKQIKQIIRELNKTDYRGARMTILSGRDHSCVHDKVLKMKNRNEGCRELNDKSKGGMCSYLSNVKSKLSTHHAVNAFRPSHQRGTAWDVEDLVAVGKKIRACPYYAARELKAKAHIVFCPYNYLIDPMIRKSMEISLKGQVLILDEAHNIEDSARSSASWQVTQDDVKEAMNDLDTVGKAGVVPESHSYLAHMFSSLSIWIDQQSDNLTDYKSFYSASKVWSGMEICGILESIGITFTEYDKQKEHLEKVIAEWKAGREVTEDNDLNSSVSEKQLPSLHSNTIAICEGLFMILEYIHVDGHKHARDYRLVLTKNQAKNRPEPKREKGRLGSWLSKSGKTGKPESNKPAFTFTLNFWCLNPAVSFRQLKQEVLSIVLTSGTLSPMSSFSSELDVSFPMKLEANHVIEKKQVWISTLSNGPTGHSLNATYRNAESFGFQDEVGRLVLRVCQTIPHGILLFLPSYSMLNKLTERWQDNGTWNRLSEIKVIICEPRFSDEFESALQRFNDIIRETTENGCGGDGTINGSLFIAVCRGKVSEGLDFADNHARAVMCVGIPFPNVKDIQVNLKKEYNAERKKEGAEILSANEWYEIQAFRALNQALGRCIRHKRDWGAILMVDDRYGKIPRYINGLSKWVRSGVDHFSNCEVMLNSLKTFNEEMTQMDQDLKDQEVALAKQAEQTEISENAKLGLDRLEKIKEAAKIPKSKKKTFNLDTKKKESTEPGDQEKPKSAQNVSSKVVIDLTASEEGNTSLLKSLENTDVVSRDTKTTVSESDDDEGDPSLGLCSKSASTFCADEEKSKESSTFSSSPFPKKKKKLGATKKFIPASKHPVQYDSGDDFI